VSYEHGDIVKVELTHADGTVKTLTGEEATKWGEYVAAQGFHAANHGMACPPFAWVETKPTTKERRVPVQGDGNYSLRPDDPRRAGAHYPGTVTWEERCEAWVGYAKRYSGQDAERIAERGGFGYAEMTEYMGHEPVTWRVHPQYEGR
jgi:hypothetical protein